jgi:UDP-N-acetylglucosamine 2-epimerase
MDRLHVFLGTKAQYIKTAPLLRLMDERAVDYRLIDSGQHAALSAGLRRELGVRDPDHVMGGSRDVDTIAQALRWSAGLGAQLRSASTLREEVFGGDGGICVVHGDTPSTFLSALMAKRAGLRTAHLEAGLRSRRLLHPFPEELIRLAVMRASDLLFAPDEQAVLNLRELRLRGEVLPVSANTVGRAAAPLAAGPARARQRARRRHHAPGREPPVDAADGPAGRPRRGGRPHPPGHLRHARPRRPRRSPAATSTRG